MLEERNALRQGLVRLRSAFELVQALLVYRYLVRIISTSDISFSWAQQEISSAHGVPSIELAMNLHHRTTS